MLRSRVRGGFLPREKDVALAARLLRAAFAACSSEPAAGRLLIHVGWVGEASPTKCSSRLPFRAPW